MNMAIDSFGRKERLDMKAELSLSTPSLENQLVLSRPKTEEHLLKKRKWETCELQEDHYFLSAGKLKTSNSSKGVDLHMKSPLPLDWEQCLDLNSGEIYYMNRRTQERTSHDPRQKLDLELKISSETSFDNLHGKQQEAGLRKSFNCEMLAAACTQCHMFVMLSKSSPSCPNCKHVQSPFNHISATAKEKTVNLLV